MIEEELKKETLGTTEKRIGLLKERLGISTIGEMLMYFPRGYEDLSEVRRVKEIRMGEVNVVKGTLGPINSRIVRGGKTLQRAVLTDREGESVECVWFNQKHLVDMFKIGEVVWVAGKAKFGPGGGIQLSSPMIEKEGGEKLHMGKIVPVYGATEGLSAKWLREKMAKVLRYVGEVVDWLPEKVQKSEGLMGRAEAVKELHLPRSKEGLVRARERIVFEEVFLLQMEALRRKRDYVQGDGGKEIKMDSEVVKDFFGWYEFEPTGDQKKVLYQILVDMEKGRPMMRLLQGDVGSGKTFVAMAAAVHTVRGGFQVAFLAPTEVLARQHFRRVKDLFEEKGVRVELLIGAQKEAEKKEVRRKIKEGEVDLVVGTHALIMEGVEFGSLGLAVVDEQHRFGVEQREKLREQGAPHFLAMSATPIPRSLALAMYGEMEVSVISEKPVGRKEILTRVVHRKNHTKALRFIEDELRKGRQAFFVYPLVQESEAEVMQDVKSAMAQYESLKEFYGDFRVGLVHGKMKSEEKEKVMKEFERGVVDVLVATTVVEVGVDVPKASVMVIEGAERFGLAQLHQLRGRVGRGSEKSYCFLFVSSEEKAKGARLEALEKTEDGFRLAEIDLELRGPGDFFGTRQSGFDELQLMGGLDARFITRCRQAAEDFLEGDDLEDYPLLEEKLAGLKVRGG